MSAHTIAHTTTITTLDAAYATFLQAISRPLPLRVSNSPAALQHRAVEIDAHILAFAAWMEVLLEDTAANVAASRKLADIATDCLDDMASEIRGCVLDAIRSTAA